jgi:hypothetical protein
LPGSYSIFGLILAIAFAASFYDILKGRRELFDDRLTAEDRNRLLRFTIFVLLPLSIIFHEAGHAIAVKLFGGEIIDFGFYFIYGFVSHRGFYTPIELGWIALAGTIMNVLLAAIAFAVFWFWPRSKAVNYVLVTFGALELANALIFYPVLDALGGIVGDWSTIYASETPAFSITVGIIHVGLLLAGFLIWRSEWFQRGYEERVGRPARRTAAGAGQRSELALVIAEASSDASGGWKHPVQLAADAQAGGLQMVLRWESNAFQRAVLVHATPPEDAAPHIELHGAIKATAPGLPGHQRAIMRIDGTPNAPQLSELIRKALDFVDSWDGATVPSPN